MPIGKACTTCRQSAVMVQDCDSLLLLLPAVHLGVPGRRQLHDRPRHRGRAAGPRHQDHPPPEGGPDGVPRGAPPQGEWIAACSRLNSVIAYLSTGCATATCVPGLQCGAHCKPVHAVYLARHHLECKASGRSTSGSIPAQSCYTCCRVKPFRLYEHADALASRLHRCGQLTGSD